MRQASGEAAWTTGCRLSAKCGTGRGLLEIGLTLFGLVFQTGSDGSCCGRPRYLARDSPGKRCRPPEARLERTMRRTAIPRWGGDCRSRGNPARRAEMHIWREANCGRRPMSAVPASAAPSAPPSPPSAATASATPALSPRDPHRDRSLGLDHGLGPDRRPLAADNFVSDCNWEKNSAGPKRSIPAGVPLSRRLPSDASCSLTMAFDRLSLIHAARSSP